MGLETRRGVVDLPSSQHVIPVLERTLPNGNQFYWDVYWLGGGDHISFKIPDSLVDDAGYAEYGHRRAYELEIVLQVIP